MGKLAGIIYRLNKYYSSLTFDSYKQKSKIDDTICEFYKLYDKFSKNYKHETALSFAEHNFFENIEKAEDKIKIANRVNRCYDKNEKKIRLLRKMTEEELIEYKY